MEIDVMSIKDIEKLQKYMYFKDQAIELYNLVIKNQKVGLLPDNSGRYMILKDGCNSEYLIQENNQWWIWVADYLFQHYDVVIDLNSIYQMMVRARESEFNLDNSETINKDKEALKYFKAYAERLSKKIS